MRNLILQMQVSVDGYVGRAGAGPNWQVWDWGPACPWDDPLKARFNADFRRTDTILLSRKILEGGYLDHWSQFAREYGDNPDFAFTQRIVEARKVVFSKDPRKDQMGPNPVALGEGLSIFRERRSDSKLELREVEGYACGIVVIRYSPRTRASARAKA